MTKEKTRILKSRADKAESSYKEAMEIDRAFRKTHRTIIREFRKNQSAVFKSRSAFYAPGGTSDNVSRNQDNHTY